MVEGDNYPEKRRTMKGNTSMIWVRYGSSQYLSGAGGIVSGHDDSVLPRKEVRKPCFVGQVRKHRRAARVPRLFRVHASLVHLVLFLEDGSMAGATLERI